MHWIGNKTSNCSLTNEPSFHSNLYFICLYPSYNKKKHMASLGKVVHSDANFAWWLPLCKNCKIMVDLVLLNQDFSGYVSFAKSYRTIRTFVRQQYQPNLMTQYFKKVPKPHYWTIFKDIKSFFPKWDLPYLIITIFVRFDIYLCYAQ